MSPGEDDASCLQLLCPGRAVGPAVGGPDPELPVGRLSAALPRSPVSLPTTRGGQGPPAMFTAPALDSIEAPPTPPRVQPPAPPRPASSCSLEAWLSARREQHGTALAVGL